MECFTPPLADIVDVIKVVVPLVFVVIYVLSQVMGANPKKPPARPQGNRPQPPPGGKDLRKEIEVFLQQAQQKAHEQQKRGQRVRPQTKRRRRPPERERELPVEAEVIEPVEIEERHLSSTVGKLESSIKGTHFKHLTSQIEQADERMEEHVHQAFDHAVGHLGHGAMAVGGAGSALDGPEGLPAKIVQMLRSPDGMRQAVVLNEILQRPENRW